MSSRNWDEASLALHNMNGALDSEYRLPISSYLWNSNEDSFLLWKCSNCTTTETKVINEGQEDEYQKEVEVPTTSRLEDIKIYEEICDPVITLLINAKTRKIWICPKCNHHDPVRNVIAHMMKYPSPHYRGYIYDEPHRAQTGLTSRHGLYPRQMEMWCRNYSIELEHRLSEYRLEYIARNGHDMDDSGYKDDGK